MIDYSKAEWVDPTLGWKPLPVSELPERLVVDFATKCNLRCAMCPVWGSEDEDAINSVKGVMKANSVRQMLDELQPAKPLVQPSIYGEPTLIPNLRERLAEMKARDMTIAMNTNGLTLDDSLAAYFVEVGVNSVFFSINSVTRETLEKFAVWTNWRRLRLQFFACWRRGEANCILGSVCPSRSKTRTVKSRKRSWSGGLALSIVCGLA